MLPGQPGIFQSLQWHKFRQFWCDLIKDLAGQLTLPYYAIEADFSSNGLPVKHHDA